MKGQEVNFDILELGDRPSALKIKDEKITQGSENKTVKSNRVDLGKAADESTARLLTSSGTASTGLDGDFVSLDLGDGKLEGQQFEALNYNHKLRRKLHRAIEAAQIKKELLVRAIAKKHCESSGIEVPRELTTEYKPIKLAGRRILEDGTLETEKQERVRKRLELAEYNKAAKVLRKQAKAEAIEAGLRLFAELTGKKSVVPKQTPRPELGNSVVSASNVKAREYDDTGNQKKRRRGSDADSKVAKKIEIFSD
jgi:hypothetical protein